MIDSLALRILASALAFLVLFLIVGKRVTNPAPGNPAPDPKKEVDE